MDKSIIRISDNRGRYIIAIEISDLQNQLVINTNSLSSGIYLIQLFGNNNLVETQKINIVK